MIPNTFSKVQYFFLNDMHDTTKLKLSVDIFPGSGFHHTNVNVRSKQIYSSNFTVDLICKLVAGISSNL